MLKDLLLLMLVLTTGAACRAAESQADFFVATDGSDDWSGTSAAPNAQRTDGPFATLQRARDAVRELKKRKSNDIVVLVREGTYQLQETVVFGLEDSGEAESTVLADLLRPNQRIPDDAKRGPHVSGPRQNHVST